MTPIDIPTLARLASLVVVGGVLLLAVTYLVEFLGPLLIAFALIIIAYLIYKYITTGHITL
jgi:hypothetical protein